MKKILLLAVACLMCSTCFGQEFRELLRPDESVLQPQTDRLTSIRTMSRQLATEHQQPALPPATRAHYLVCESWCAHCPARKADFLRRGWPESNVLTNDECDARFGFRVPRVPYEFEEPVEVVKTKMVVKTKTEPVTRSMSHSEMVALHNRLHGGGQWTWPGDLERHLQETHGVGTVTSTVIRSSSQSVSRPVSNCPGGVCPTSSRPTMMQRGGLFWRR